MAVGIESCLVALAGAVIALLWVVVDWGAWTLVVPGRGRPRDPDPAPKPAPMQPAGPGPWKDLDLEVSDGTLLSGALSLHAEANGRTLVLLHGFAEDRSALVGRAAAIGRTGWNTVILDARARGQSGGSRCTFGTKEVGDVLAWLEPLRSRIGPGARFAFWGRSMGAAIALGAAEAEGSVHALVLEAPYASLRASVAAALRRRRIPAWLAGPMLKRAARLAGTPLDAPPPIDRARLFQRPVLILAGADDPIAPRAEIGRLAAAFPGHPRVITIPGAHHNDVFDLGGPELAAEITAFLNAAMPPNLTNLPRAVVS